MSRRTDDSGVRHTTEALYAEMTGQRRRLDPSLLTHPLPPAGTKPATEPPRVRPWWDRVMPGRRG